MNWYLFFTILGVCATTYFVCKFLFWLDKWKGKEKWKSILSFPVSLQISILCSGQQTRVIIREQQAISENLIRLHTQEQNANAAKKTRLFPAMLIVMYILMGRRGTIRLMHICILIAPALLWSKGANKCWFAKILKPLCQRLNYGRRSTIWNKPMQHGATAEKIAHAIRPLSRCLKHKSKEVKARLSRFNNLHKNFLNTCAI